ncbi:hypothetical protein [Actinoplanes regularis]|uniref:hypothetical protein n=1 Tax=Actinoplanes regularis TaxID=52697 RepID=UPI001EF2B7E6|nr:hypothetical protein [Actinoplanes regularis]
MNVSGLDRSPEMIAVARQTHPPLESSPSLPQPPDLPRWRGWSEPPRRPSGSHRAI